MAKSKPVKLLPHVRLDRGIQHLEVLTKLISGFVEDQANKLAQWEHFTLVEMLEDIAVDLNAGRNAMLEQDNIRVLALRASDDLQAGRSPLTDGAR